MHGDNIKAYSARPTLAASGGKHEGRDGVSRMTEEARMS